MMFSIKRLVAKIIDVVLFFISGFFILTIFTLIFTFLFSDFILSNVYLTEFVNNMPSGDLDAMVVYMDSYYNLVMLLGLVGSFLMILFGYIYFGILGKYTYGSLGKYAMHVRVVNLDESRCLSTKRLFIREPLIHIMVIGMLSSALSLLWMPLGMLGSIGYYTYIILFVIGFDFWNKYTLFKLV